MGLTATQSGGGDFEMTPEGTYIGRCYRIIDLGTQTSAKFGSQQHKVMVSWELLDDKVKMEDGRPFSVHQTYTVSLSDKAKLRADLEAWRGKKFTKEELEGFDLTNVLGAYCMIQVVHSDDGQFANVNAIMSYKGDKPEPVNPDLVFDIDEPDMQIFNSLSDNMKAKIMQAPEWDKSKQATSLTDEPEPKNKDVVIEDIGDEPINLDDIPF